MEACAGALWPKNPTRARNANSPSRGVTVGSGGVQPATNSSRLTPAIATYAWKTEPLIPDQLQMYAGTTGVSAMCTAVRFSARSSSMRRTTTVAHTISSSGVGRSAASSRSPGLRFVSVPER
jgi:hypothetical protein